MDKTGKIFKIVEKYSEIEHSVGLKDLTSIVCVPSAWNNDRNKTMDCYFCLELASDKPLCHKKSGYPGFQLTKEIDPRDLILYTHLPEKSQAFFVLLREFI